jgi:hypothetical protein
VRCEELIKEEFGESCNFDVDDAVQKLEKLGIIARVRLPTICSLIKLELLLLDFYSNKSVNLLLISF